ncbi:MAG: TadE/TadG family type IV pilus assembly protein, partial [Anaerolineales bacterium]
MTLFIRRTTKRSLGQGLVEFALVLPVLLLLIFGIIEFARLFAAWLAIQNAARFGVRYAVTGRFDPQYCDEGMAYFAGRDADGNNIAWITASEDTAPNPLANGANDPANDCNIPRGVTEYEEKTEALQDYARLLSTWDATRNGAVAINLSTNPAVSGNYRNYLDNIWRSKGTVSDATTARANFGQLASYIGNPTASGYFNVSICSFATDATILRDATYTYFWNSQTSNPDAQYPAPCTRRIGTGNTYMYTDHPGAPSTRMQVLVTFRHPLITPFVSSLWPSIKLVASRDGIVESFRKSKDVVLPSGPSGISTATPTPTNSATPTQTATATQTATPFPCSGNGATYEQWDGITGTSVTDLRNDPRYPDEPTSRGTRTTFNSGQNLGDNYGGVVRALVCVPTTGNYRFWLNTDDGGELLLYTTP